MFKFLSIAFLLVFATYANAQELDRVQAADAQYNYCRQMWLNDPAKAKLISSAPFTLENYCRCVGNNLAAIITPEEANYMKINGSASEGFMAKVAEVRKDCVYVTPHN